MGCGDIVILCKIGITITVLLILNIRKNYQIKYIYRYGQGEAMYKFSFDSVSALLYKKITNVEWFQTQMLSGLCKFFPRCFWWMKMAAPKADKNESSINGRTRNNSISTTNSQSRNRFKQNILLLSSSSLRFLPTFSNSKS